MSKLYAFLADGMACYEYAGYHIVVADTAESLTLSPPIRKTSLPSIGREAICSFSSLSVIGWSIIMCVAYLTTYLLASSCREPGEPVQASFL